MNSRPAIFILGPSALPLAQRLQAHLDADIHGPEGLCNVGYTQAIFHLQSLFAARTPIIGICAAAILVRAIGGLAKDKHIEPPVVAVSEDGGFAVPLLGGHHGANDLARRIADVLSGQAAITTASDVALGVSLDQPPQGYVLADPALVKPLTARLLAGEKLKCVDGDAAWLASVISDQGTIPLAVTSTIAKPDVLTYHPRSLTIGIGCERGTDPQEVADLVEATLTENGLARASIATFASIDLKEDEAAITALGPVRFFTTKELNAQSSRLMRPSEVVRAEVGTPSVAEAAALCAAGPDAELIVPKLKSKRATIAIAEATYPLAEALGRARGTVHLVGIGPGDKSLRSPAVTQALQATTDWVGYGLYLNLVNDLHTEQQRHEFPLGGEEGRCRHAITLAKQGKQVALVCSGDAAIYAMAALVYELIDREPCRIAVEVHPGISAFQLASARAGALIGHDFCCISLSDLLTPWETIRNRVAAASRGDFVVAFYNPRSQNRTSQIVRAMAILRQNRGPDTPVVIATSLGRPEEKVKIVRLEDFNPKEVDMLTLVMVGSSQSKAIKRGDGMTYAYTPRGYARKMDADNDDDNQEAAE